MYKLNLSATLSTAPRTASSLFGGIAAPVDAHDKVTMGMDETRNLNLAFSICM